MNTARVGIYGSGRTAAELVSAIRLGPHELTTSIVHSAHRSGRDFGDLTVGKPIGVMATADLEGAVGSGEFDVLLYAGLGGERHVRAIEVCADAGVDMVHACFGHPRTALGAAAFERLADRAVSTGARIVATGLSSGFFFDVLPVLLTSALPTPVSVRARKVSDLSVWSTNDLVDLIGVGTRRSGSCEGIDALLAGCAQVIADVLGLHRTESQVGGGLTSAQQDTWVGTVEVSRGEVEGFDQSVVMIEDGLERVELSFCGLADPASRGMPAGGELSLNGGDGSELGASVIFPKDPYPGTAARMIQAVSVLRDVPPGLHPATVLPVG